MGRVGTDEIGCHDRRTRAGGPCNVCDGEDKDAISLHNDGYRQISDQAFCQFWARRSGACCNLRTPGGLLQRIVQRVSVDRLLRDAAASSSLTQNLIQITRPSRH